MATNRREFFRKAGQLTCLSALVGGSGILLTNNRVSLYGCGDNQFCESCRKIEHCNLDQASQQRKNIAFKQGLKNQK
jgi:hypothetical protein